jgi:uncharacterized membrane protein/thiol-disulfide isomerase/thioredoxin
LRKTLLLFFAIFLALNIPCLVKVNARQSEKSVVHVILFYSNGCPFCNQVLNRTLPELEQKYHAQLNILLINVTTLDDVDNLYSLGAALGLSKEQAFVPFLLVDHNALVGVEEIDAQLPGLVEHYLANGGIDLPNTPQLASVLSKGIDFTSLDAGAQFATQTAISPSLSGLPLAQGVMAIMVIAIILAVILIARSLQGKALKPLKGWLDISIPILCLVGMGVSIYLTYIEISHVQAVCGPVGDCNTVQSSSYAKLFGFFPVGLLGALGYLAILVTWLWRRYRSSSLTQATGLALFGMSMFGSLFSVYLTYLEIFIIHAVCIWCLSSAIVITALMLLTLPHITQWLAISDDEE